MARGGAPAGDCIDCSWCQQVCPTGIDIREGLQLECIHCTACIDACNAVMDRTGRPQGLIRYSTQNRIDGLRHCIVRYRLVIYVAILAGLAVALSVLLARRAPLLVEQVRTAGFNFSELADGTVRSPVRLLLENRTESTVRCVVVGTGDVAVEGGRLAVEVPALDAVQADMAVLSAASGFARGSREAVLTVDSGHGPGHEAHIRLAGPFGNAGRKEAP